MSARIHPFVWALVSAVALLAFSSAAWDDRSIDSRGSSLQSKEPSKAKEQTEPTKSPRPTLTIPLSQTNQMRAERDPDWPIDPPEPTTTIDWTPVSHHCGPSTCGYVFDLPPGACTDANLFGPACGVALAAQAVLEPGRVYACAGGIFGCAVAGDYNPCTTSRCQMTAAIQDYSVFCDDNDPARRCAAGTVCVSGRCVPDCQVGSDGCGQLCDPADPLSCPRGECNADGRCEVCTANSCVAGFRCDQTTGRCSAVETCSETGSSRCVTGNCVNGECQVCGRDFQCTAPEICNAETGRCSEPNCTTADECWKGAVCADGFCRDACTSDDMCAAHEYCNGEYCAVAKLINGRCPRPNMTPNAAGICVASCVDRPRQCDVPGLVCDPTTGECAVVCDPANDDCGFAQVCQANRCISTCHPDYFPCPEPQSCVIDVETGQPSCVGMTCDPALDRCCGVICDQGTCDPATGFCTGGFDPCAGVNCFPPTTCVEGQCRYGGTTGCAGGCPPNWFCNGLSCVPGCLTDWDCPPEYTCDNGTCTNVTITVCEPGDPCHGGGGGFDPSLPCDHNNNPTTFAECESCSNGGRVVWIDGQAFCEVGSTL